MKESDVHRELESTKVLQPYYERIVEQLSSHDQKAQAMIGLEGLLLALMAAFASSIPNNPGHLPVRVAAWGSMVLILASALCSLLVMRIRYGTVIIASSKTVDEGILNFGKWRDQKLTLHNASLDLLAAGLFGLMIVLSLSHTTLDLDAWHSILL